MTLYIYSAKNNCFVESERIDYYESCGWDLSDAVDVEDSVFEEFTRDRAFADGVVRVAGEDGYPTWGPAPEKSQEEVLSDNNSKKQSLKAVADGEIAWRQDAVDADIATDEETADLAAWKKYRVLLMRVDTSNPEWPEKPE